MALSDEYKEQFAWRDWASVFSKLPLTSGQKILDLGCGPGDIAAELTKMGATVTGIDGNGELLTVAKNRCPTGTFENQNLSSLNLPLKAFDGLWCSFAAAYFVDFHATFREWQKFLKDDAWVCLVEIDDLFGHEPMSDEAKNLTQKFYDNSLAERLYDFQSGRKLQSVLEEAGYRVSSFEMKDAELAFNGPALPLVRQAWEKRFNRMGRLKAFLGPNFLPFVEEFLKVISSNNHHSRCKVICCIGTKN